MTEVTTHEETAHGRTIEKTLEIVAPVDAVWEALTDPDALVRWFPLDARVRPGPEGSIWMSWRASRSSHSRSRTAASSAISLWG